MNVARCTKRGDRYIKQQASKRDNRCVIILYSRSSHANYCQMGEQNVGYEQKLHVINDGDKARREAKGMKGENMVHWTEGL